MNYKRIAAFGMLSLALVLCGCQNKASADNEATQQKTEISYEDNDYYTEYENAAYTEIDLDKENGDVTIQEAGTYELHGSLKGSILVNAKDEVVRLILKQVSINAESGPAIRCSDGKKLILSLYEGTKNQLSDTADLKTTEYDATIFVQNDLTINGSGSLVIEANIQNAVKAKDTLKLMEGNIQIQSVDNGIIGKDALYVHAGSYQIKAEGDAMKSTYDKDDEKGDIMIENGDFQLESGQDGIQATRSLVIYNGSFHIESGGGSENGVKAANAFQPGGFGHWNQPQSETAEDALSAKGLKAEAQLTITDGSFALNTSDDSLHANGDITINGGNLTLASGDDGIHSDQTLTIQNGHINVTESYEGLEGADIMINGGDIQVCSSDDGINAAGGSDNDNSNQPSPDQFMQGGANKFEIHGGTILIDAKGDGLDSNGTIEMYGGSAVVFGPSDGGNGALDYDKAFTISGGILIAVGSSQMAQTPSNSSTQPVLMLQLSQQDANTLFYLCDYSGNPIIGAFPKRAYSNIVVSTPKLELTKEYQLYIGGSGTANDAGYIESGLQGGSLNTTITLNDIITQNTQNGAQPGGFPHNRGNRGNDFPTDTEHMPPQEIPSQTKKEL